MADLPNDRELVIAEDMEDRDAKHGPTYQGWNPIASQIEALELEGMVPEELRQEYQANLDNLICETVPVVNLRFPGEIGWLRLRRTPRQIATAVWLTCCKEGK